jgi:hypothetical protein
VGRAGGVSRWRGEVAAPVACGVAWGEEWEPGRRGKEEACVGADSRGVDCGRIGVGRMRVGNELH